MHFYASFAETLETLAIENPKVYFSFKSPEQQIQNPEVKQEPIPYGTKPPSNITAANSLWKQPILNDVQSLISSLLHLAYMDNQW